MIMKNIIKFSLTFYILGMLFLPLTTLAADTYICDGNCAVTACKTYAFLAEANNKCVPPDGVADVNACKAKIGACPGDTTSTPVSAPSAPVNNKQNIIKLSNPLVGVYGVTDILSTIIKVAMSVMGAAVLLMVVKGATTWITAGGNAESIESGTKTIIWAILGAILTVVSYLLLSSIIDAFFHPLAQ